MVISCIDIETYKLNKNTGYYEPILNPKDYILGGTLEEGKQPEYYETPREQWNALIKRGQTLRNNKKVLNVYGHNIRYDYYGIVNLREPNIIYNCEKPFITTYTHNGKTAIKFLDTMGIYNMSLKKAGELIGMEKLEMPKQIKDKKELQQYLQRDLEITMALIKKIQDKNREEGIYIKRIYTIRQIAINYNLQKIKQIPNYPLQDLFYNADRNQLHHTRYETEIINAYRGGRVECFNTGIYT